MFLRIILYNYIRFYSQYEKDVKQSDFELGKFAKLTFLWIVEMYFTGNPSLISKGGECMKFFPNISRKIHFCWNLLSTPKK